MKTATSTAVLLAVALSANACSTKPRSFSATVTPVEARQIAAQPEADVFATCNMLVRKGHKGNFAAAAASSGAAGLAMFGGAAAVAASGTVGIGVTTGGAVLSAAVPVVGLLAGFGVNRMIRSGRERKYKRVMGDCMQELGYEVTDWTRAPKKQPGSATLRQPAVDTVVTPAIETAPAQTAEAMATVASAD